MGCNCGDNEYNITVNNNGNCEPTTPIYNITLANVGVNGYSPIVRFINETVESFNIAVDNITGTETSPAVPKLSYVADQINNAIAGLSSTYLTRDGSNAANPISLNGLQISSSSGDTSINISGIATYTSTGATLINAPAFDLNANGGEIYIYTDYGIGLNAATDKDIYLDTSGTGKAKYNDKEIATIDQIPTVGNGTITIVQGGVNKGTFTTNQSGNTTIELDEGGGITNPLTISNTTEQGTTYSLSLGVNTSNNKIVSSYNIESGGGGLYFPIYLVGNTTVPITKTEDNFGLYTIGIAYDTTTLGLNTNNELTVINSGSSYTAGTGIDISNDTISVDSTVLTTNTAQTITEDKTFNADIHLNGGDIKLDSTTSYIQGKTAGGTYRNIIARSVASSEMVIGNQGDVLKLAGSLPYPKYNNVDMALLTDIPTVYNSTITFTQGGVTKGTITLNQSSDATIALDAGGSGAVDSVNGQTGTVVLTASDVGALPSTTVIPTKTSDLTNDSGFITNSALSGYATETWVGQQGYLTANDLPTNYVTTDTAQNITGTKTFSGNIKTDTVYNTNNNPILQIYNSTIRVGNSNYGLKLLGDSTRPEYSMDSGTNYNQLALLSDIPTVNNPTITFTQGGTTKGTITLNQSSNQTIALDAGSGATIDDNTPSTTTVYSSQKVQDLINALVARIMTLEANINGGNA